MYGRLTKYLMGADAVLATFLMLIVISAVVLRVHCVIFRVEKARGSSVVGKTGINRQNLVYESEEVGTSQRDDVHGEGR